jgi:hypothetical protein
VSRRRSVVAVAVAVAGAAAAVLLLLVATTPAAHADDALRGRRLFDFRDDRIIESSGLVDHGRTVLTINDSGDRPVVYSVDARTGATVATTTYAGTVSDVEDLAPGAHGTVWAGDTGDNQHRRSDISVYHVTPDGSEQQAPRFRLAYPDGPHDAETLLVHPRTGQVLVVSKSVFGGTVYAAPSHLRRDGTNRLRTFAHVAGLVTDGTFLPDGRRVVLRTYATASVYTWPGFGLVGTVRLPAQEQGEGISVSRTGRVLLSSEGKHSDVLSIRLPRRLLSGSPSGASGGPPPSTHAPSAGPAVTSSHRSRSAGDWAGIAAVGLGFAAVVLVVVRGVPRRSRRSR